MRSLPCDSARRSGVANPLIRGSQPVWMVTRVAREAKRARSSPFPLPGEASPSSRSAGAVGRSSSMAMSMQDKVVESASRASPRARINCNAVDLHAIFMMSARWRGGLGRLSLEFQPIRRGVAVTHLGVLHAGDSARYNELPSGLGGALRCRDPPRRPAGPVVSGRPRGADAGRDAG